MRKANDEINRSPQSQKFFGKNNFAGNNYFKIWGILISFALSFATCAQTIYLTSQKTGKKYGPFVISDKSKISLGNDVYIVSSQDSSKKPQSARKVRNSPDKQQAGTIRFADGKSRKFKNLTGMRPVISHSFNQGTTMKLAPVAGKLVISRFKQGEVTKESLVPVSGVCRITVKPQGNDYIVVDIYSLDGKKESFTATGFIIQVDWTDSLASETIMIANHKNSQKYFGMEISFDRSSKK